MAGDTGTGPGTDIEATVDQMVEESQQDPYDGLVLLGDLIYPEGEAAETDSRVLEVFSPVLDQGTRLLPVLGNHDYMSGEQSEILNELGREHPWYAEQIGAVRVVVLDTERIDDAEQTRWLRETLASATPASWTVVAMHKPAYSAGMHGSDSEVQDTWVPLFEEFDVPLVLAGHDHDYQRSTPLDGVTYVVTGGAAVLRPTGEEEFTEVSTSTQHYVDLEVEADRLTGRALDESGREIDSFELSR